MTDTMEHPPVTTEHMEIGPDLAEKWLENLNRHNRPKMDYHVRDLAEDMKDNRFLDTGENGVRFDWDGFLCGGQHTLAAIVLSGKTQRLAVTRNVDPRARAVMNDALKQRFAHDLATQGVQKNGNQIESLVRAALLWDRTAVQHKGHGGLATFRTTGKFTRSTLIGEWPKYAKSAVETMDATTAWNNTKVWPGNRGAMHFLWWVLVYRFEIAPELVTEFFDKICYGSSDRAEGNLILKLRQKYNENKDKHVQVHWTLRVWNMIWKGDIASKLQAPKGSLNEKGDMILTDPYPRAFKPYPKG